MKIFTFLVSFLWIAASMQAQELERKGSLGAMVSAAEDGSGILIPQVLPNGTAASIGLQAGDVVLSINDQRFTEVSPLVAQTKAWREGEEITIQLKRGDQQLELKGKVKGKPKESSDKAKVVYGAVPFQQGQLRSILELPKGVENPPVVFFLQGFGCNSIDYYYNPLSPIKQLVEGLVEKGIAVYRVEKPGLGDSKGTPACEDIGYHLEVDAFAESLKMLKTIDGIDSDNVYLFGHSLGGVTAPLLAERIPVKGIVNYGSVATTWYEYILEIFRKQKVIRGWDLVEAEEELRRREPIIHDFLVKKMKPSELRANPAYEGLLSTGWPMIDENDKTLSRHYSFMQEINETNTTKALKNADVYFLGIHGEFDIHAIDADWAEMQAATVNAYHPGKGEWMILKGTEHGFAKVPSMAENLRLRKEGLLNGEYMGKHFNAELVEVVSNWIKKVQKKTQNG
ncbi:MAG: alpha/beta fold hydrolase [Bacteroidota bacterium]